MHYDLHSICVAGSRRLQHPEGVARAIQDALSAWVTPQRRAPPAAR